MSTGKALICKLGQHIPISGADRIVQVDMFGETIITQKTNEEGTIGLLFDCETQLSHEFCSANNLYRNKELNSNKEIVGYFEDNRRVRPIKLKGVKCSGMWIGLESLYSLDIKVPNLDVGQEIDTINEVPICSKYIPKKTREAGTKNKEGRVNKASLCPTFKEHLDTDQIMRNLNQIKEGNLIIITEKLHGTSGRCGYLQVKKAMGIWYRLMYTLFRTLVGFKDINKQWNKSKTQLSYKFVVGSRRVVKRIGEETSKNKIEWDRLSFNGRKKQVDFYLKTNLKDTNYELYRKVFPETTKSNEVTLEHVDQYISGFKEYFLSKNSGYYNTDIWSQASERFRDKLYKGETIYFEIVGYLPDGTPIMGTQSNDKLKKFMEKDEYKQFIENYGNTTEFSYGCNKSEYKVFVYRITRTNEDGETIDLSWDQVKNRCEILGVAHVPEIMKKLVSEGYDHRDFEEAFRFLTDQESTLFPQHIKEGIVVRIDNGGMTPKLFKNKSYIFKVLEGIIKDSNQVDIEESN